jgi:hypothetical protein
MKAIVCDIIISSVSTSSDKSLRFRASTPELSDTEAVAFMGLRGINIRALLEPSDYAVEGKVEVKGEMETKTPGERLRAVLYCLYKHEKPAETFATFYVSKMEKMIDHCKSKLPPIDG